MKTDTELLAHHDVKVRARARIEMKIVDSIIASAKRDGYKLVVTDYEPDDDMNGDIRAQLFNLDDAHVLVIDGNGNQLGWVYLVFGNDGYDLVSDYTLSLESFLEDTNKLANKLEETGG